MRLPPLFLAVSLLANGALLGALALRPSLAPPAFRDFFARYFHFSDAAGPAAPAVASAAPRERFWATLGTGGDLVALAARLRAAGFPPAVIREIIRAQVNALYEPRIRALVESDPTTPFWKLQPAFPGDKRFEEMNQLRSESIKMIRELLSDEFFFTADVSKTQRAR